MKFATSSNLLTAIAVAAAATPAAFAADPYVDPEGYDCFILQTTNGAIDEDSGCISGICPGIDYLVQQGYDQSEVLPGGYLYQEATEYFLGLIGASDQVLFTNSSCLSEGAGEPGCDVAAELCTALALEPCPQLVVLPFTLDESVNLRARVFTKTGVSVDVPPEGLKIIEGGFAGVSLDYIETGIAVIPPLTSFFVGEYKYIDEDNDDAVVSTISFRSKTPGFSDPFGSRALLQEVAFGSLLEKDFLDPGADVEGISTAYSGSFEANGIEYSSLRNLITCSDIGI